jgi:hypothetical protein
MQQWMAGLLDRYRMMLAWTRHRIPDRIALSTSGM